MKEQIDKYFLEEICPYAKRRKLKDGVVKKTCLWMLSIGVVVILVFSPKKSSNNANTQHQSAQNSNSNSQGEAAISSSGKSTDIFNDSYKSQRPSRKYEASQLVKDLNTINTGDKLPMGSTILARLINKVLTSDSNSPLIAEINDDIVWQNSVLIPKGTRAIGEGSLDLANERLQARFQTLVYPEGDEHSISAIALLPDGSSGIAGDFHSQGFKKEAGRFFGNFVGGLAQGMKEKDSAGQLGMIYEPGTLKNGLLNGLSTSAFDEANSYSEDAQKLSPYLEVPSQTPFVLYLEKEYSP